MLLLEGLFEVGGDTQLTHHLPFLAIFNFDLRLEIVFVPLPCWGEVCATLGTDEGHGVWVSHLAVQQDVLHTLLQAQQVDEFSVVGVRDEMHLWRWWFGGWNPE